MFKSTLKSILFLIDSGMELLLIIMKVLFPLVALFCAISISEPDLKNIAFVIWIMFSTVLWQLHSKE